MEKTIKLIGIFDSLEIEVTKATTIPLNAVLLHSVQNLYCYTNYNYIFFRGMGEDGRMNPVKCKWSIELELKINAVI